MSTATLSFDVRDVSGQKSARIDNCPADACVDELLPTLLESLSLPRSDVDGNPMTHTLRRDSDGSVLNGAQIVGDVLEEGAQVVVQPDINAG